MDSDTLGIGPSMKYCIKYPYDALWQCIYVDILSSACYFVRHLGSVSGSQALNNVTFQKSKSSAEE